MNETFIVLFTWIFLFFPSIFWNNIGNNFVKNIADNAAKQIQINRKWCGPRTGIIAIDSAKIIGIKNKGKKFLSIFFQLTIPSTINGKIIIAKKWLCIFPYENTAIVVTTIVLKIISRFLLEYFNFIEYIVPPRTVTSPKIGITGRNDKLTLSSKPNTLFGIP